MSYFYEKEFETWGGFGPAGQFRVYEFLTLFITIFSRIQFTVKSLVLIALLVLKYM